MTLTTDLNPVTLQTVLAVGDRLRDGTIVLSIDLANERALFLHPNFLRHDSVRQLRHRVAEKLNAERAHGHDDWRNITDDEGLILAREWEKVAPEPFKYLPGLNFWAESAYGLDAATRIMWSGYDQDRDGSRYRGDYIPRMSRGKLRCSGILCELPTPCVRSGPLPTL